MSLKVEVNNGFLAIRRGLGRADYYCILPKNEEDKRELAKSLFDAAYSLSDQLKEGKRESEQDTDSQHDSKHESGESSSGQPTPALLSSVQPGVEPQTVRGKV